MTIARMRWVVAAMLLTATVINYVDRLTLPVVIGSMRKEFALSEQDYSQVVSIFLVAYALMYAGSGYVVDRLGTRRGFASFMFGWSVAQMLHGAVRGKWSLAGFRFLLGLTEPGNFPAAVKAVGEWFPPGRRAIGVGVFNAGSSLGSAIAVPMAAFLTLRYGWRFTFLFTGGLGMIWLCFWLLFYDTPEKHRWLAPADRTARGDAFPAPDGEPGSRAADEPWLGLLAKRQCYSLALARFLSDPVIYFVTFWLPEYLRKERGFDLARIGSSGWIPFLFGDVGYVLGGWLSSYLMSRGWPLAKARKTAMAAGAALLPAAIAAPFANSAEVAIGAICFVVLGHAIWVANLLTLPADLFPGSQVGRVSGISGMGGAIGGILANLAIGRALASFSYLPLFAVAGVLHPLAWLLVCYTIPSRLFAESAGRPATKSSA
jgi:ACS family hexuronate transporter-like MFS transporter